MQDFNINSKPVAHMMAQIRAKQSATRDSQNKEQEAIVAAWEEQGHDKSGEAIGKKIVKDLEKFYNASKSINGYLKSKTPEGDDVIKATEVGYPVKSNKTDLQLKMSWDYAKQQGDNLIEQIKSGKFYNGLSNDINSEELPWLQSDNKSSYWGNENSSVSSVLFASIASVLETEVTPFIGATTYYPFYNSKYKLPENLLSENYSFADEDGMILFGDYQFGGRRNFKDPLIFGPEDCSSSVGKATYLTTEQVKGINTAQIRENPSNYGYEVITTLNSNIDQKQLELIQPGDIYLYKSHTAIIATR